ncbi:NAD(P)H-hydrate dehydratase [Sapientia aquatica]|uniref:Bifunctional NAD(P)H-hydrate repair enzyme n=1 Tax=Sapientia aquatica TaxID=1549640 RepID=A0A4R5W413_9BURK|nr:NAD(P)H-hydrate dehydratase [Sapientia aquatica]TDK67085.1 NAD(P)H-hydrate dehydratase [Sapientia aquatica]
MINLTTALLSVNQMQCADRLTTASDLPVAELMSNAGLAVAQAIIERWSMRPVVVLCGPGNNGGDGFSTARHLFDLGWSVKIALLGAADHLNGAPLLHFQRWHGAVIPFAEVEFSGDELVVDAIFGAGLNRPLDADVISILEAALFKKLPMVAIDVPTGVMGDTGQSFGAVAVVLTVTFLRKKPGHVILPGRLLCGEVVVADIGYGQQIASHLGLNTFENDPLVWLPDFPVPHPFNNKYSRGHALIAGGYPVTGAARLAALSAARVGSGLTTIAIPEIALPIYGASLLSIMLEIINSSADIERLLNDKRYTAFLIGPGCGVTPDDFDLIRIRVLAMLATKRATVIDADAISCFRDDPKILFKAIEGPCVITPHEGEFSRIFDLKGDKLMRTRFAARISGAVIVLKGSDTIIAAPDGRAIINTNAPASLATAGAGDVLSGLILGLLAQGMDAFLASAAAVWLHGEAANDIGLGLIADDLPEAIPAILDELLHPH